MRTRTTRHPNPDASRCTQLVVSLFEIVTETLFDAMIHAIVPCDGDNMSLTHHLRAIATPRVTNEDP